MNLFVSDIFWSVIIFMKSAHAIAWSYLSFIFIAMYHLKMIKNNYTYLYININELFCFQFGAVKNNAAITLLHVFFGTPLHTSLLGIYFTGNCWIKGYVFDQIYRTLSKSFSKVSAQIYALTGNVWEHYWVSIWTVHLPSTCLVQRSP